LRAALNKPARPGDVVRVEGDFEIEMIGRGDGMRVTISGELDATTMRALVARLWSGGASATDTIVLDLSEVTSVDVGGVEELFALKELLGRRLRLERSRPQERERITAGRPADPHRGQRSARRSLFAHH
jgi:anti-anti-sigma regulatory factor